MTLHSNHDEKEFAEFMTRAVTGGHDPLHHLEIAWQEIFTALGLEVGPGVEETPTRAAKVLLEMTAGYQVDVPSLFKTFEGNGYDEMVVLRDIDFSSLCEHHVLPFMGRASIAYVPDGRIIGLSKIARVVDAYARRLQVQERLTNQIADAFMDHLSPKGVAVILEATHTCMALRGVRKSGATMVTSCLRGVLYDDPRARSEALALLGVTS